MGYKGVYISRTCVHDVLNPFGPKSLYIMYAETGIAVQSNIFPSEHDRKISLGKRVAIFVDTCNLTSPGKRVALLII